VILQKNILATKKFIIKRCGAFRPNSAWHLEIEIFLTSFNNIYIYHHHLFAKCNKKHNKITQLGMTYY